MKTKLNPVLYTDFPDPDIIRVGDTYYLASTTMHFMPGCDILRSYDLMNWEFVSHVYETLEDIPGHRLEGGAHIYGQGMWAPSLRYHEGFFIFVLRPMIRRRHICLWLGILPGHGKRQI